MPMRPSPGHGRRRRRARWRSWSAPMKTSSPRSSRCSPAAGPTSSIAAPVGCGQVVKLLNNMVMVETVVAISEALAIGKRAGVDGERLFAALSKGSADSFALRHHGMKAVLPGVFPERAFSTVYARKDLEYALDLAWDVNVAAQG